MRGNKFYKEILSLNSFTDNHNSIILISITFYKSASNFYKKIIYTISNCQINLSHCSFQMPNCLKSNLSIIYIKI